MNDSLPISQAWKYCPRCGRAVAKPGARPFQCLNCGYLHYFSPCTAVGAIITDDRGQVLFIVRGKEPGQGKLGLPGGFVDPGETAETALVREVLEETGLQIQSYRFLASFPNRYAYGGVVVPVTDLFFVADVRTFADVQVQEEEIEGFRFLNPADVPPADLAFDTHRLALKALLAR